MLEKSRSILFQVILISFIFLRSISIQAQESPYALDAPCQIFGNYPTLEEIKKAKLKNDPTKILVKTVKGDQIEVLATDAYDAIQISDEKALRQYMKTYESICGKGSKPPFYNSIQFAAEVELKNCISKAARFKKSKLIRGNFWKSEAEQKAISICVDTRDAISGSIAPLNSIDPKCPDFGILTLKKKDLENVKVKNNSQKVWVKTLKEGNIAIREDMLTEAFKISNDDALLSFYVNYVVVCGKEELPPFFDAIPYVESQTFKLCVWNLEKKNDPRAESECYEKLNESRK
ncbi:hypothetical protein [Leptospira santarosai]|uniref:hypothetical protein n=1 Tax=Leptospira santarosai TaxID=28183 RepID=UPI003D15FFF4